MIEKVDKFISCLNPKCLRKILQATSASIVHCDRYGNSMRTIKCKSHICIKFVLKIEEQNIHLTAFEKELKNVIESDLSKYTELEITEILIFFRKHFYYLLFQHTNSKEHQINIDNKRKINFQLMLYVYLKYIMCLTAVFKKRKVKISFNMKTNIAF